MIIRLLIFFIFFQIIPIEVICQIDSTNDDEAFDNLIEESAGDNEDSQILDNIEELINNPLNLNTVTIKELIRIPFIDLGTAVLINDYVKKSGHIFSVNELYLIKNIDKAILNKVVPFLTVETRPKTINSNGTNYYQNKIKLSMRSRILNDLQNRKGFIENKYAGSRSKIYNRIKIKVERYFQAGFITEKDAGERSINDFSAFHLAGENLGIIDKLIIGDFNLEFGQGLALSNPYGFYKGGNAVTQINKSDRNITPYLSSDENRFFRGAAININTGIFSFSTFFSSHKLDANIDSITNNINSRVTDGYHRTETELKKKKSLKEIFYGGRINILFNETISIGFLYYHSQFDHYFQPSSVYDITGNKFNCYSLAYSFQLDKLFLFGEVAGNNSIATINSLALSITPDISAVISIRNYPKDYFPLYSSGFAEGSIKNEFGVYTGFTFKTKLGDFNFYFDQYKFPYATYYESLPSRGTEFYLNYTKYLNSNIFCNLRYKNDNKETTNDNNPTKQIIQSIKSEFEYQITPKLKLKSRFDYLNYLVTVKGITENGYMIYQEVKANPIEKLSLYLRVIFFQTDSYNSRLYEFENDLPGTFSSYAAYGSGYRWYILLKYEIKKLFLISIKYSETIKPNDRHIGTGYQEINGNLDNKINLQIDFTY